MKSSVYQWGRFLLRAAADEKQAADTWPADVQTSPKIRRGSLFFNRISAGYLLVVDATTDVSCRPRSLQKLFSAARDTGAGVLLVSAEPDEVLSLSDRVAVIHAGQIVAEVDPDAVHRPRSPDMHRQVFH